MFNIFKNHPSKDCKESKNINANFGNNSYFYSIGSPVWSERNYNQFAGHAYTKNVIAYRAINLVSQDAASVPLKLYEFDKRVKQEKNDHAVLSLLKSPNPLKSGVELLSEVYIYRQIHGNAYLLAVSDSNSKLVCTTWHSYS